MPALSASRAAWPAEVWARPTTSLKCHLAAVDSDERSQAPQLRSGASCQGRGTKLAADSDGQDDQPVLQVVAQARGCGGVA